MKRIIYGDQFDIKDFIKNDFLICVVSKKANIEMNDCIFTLPDIFPCQEAIDAWIDGNEDDFYLTYTGQLNKDEEAKASLFGLLYGIVEHDKKILFIKYIEEIKVDKIGHEREGEVIQVPFLEAFAAFLQNNYGISGMTTSDYLEKFKDDTDRFISGTITGKYLENYNKLKDKYGKLIEDEAPLKEDLEKTEEVKVIKEEIPKKKEPIQKKETKPKVVDIDTHRADICKKYSHLNIDKIYMSLASIRYMEQEEIDFYCKYHGIYIKLLKYLNVSGSEFKNLRRSTIYAAIREIQ